LSIGFDLAEPGLAEVNAYPWSQIGTTSFERRGSDRHLA